MTPPFGNRDLTALGNQMQGLSGAVPYNIYANLGLQSPLAANQCFQDCNNTDPLSAIQALILNEMPGYFPLPTSRMRA